MMCGLPYIYLMQGGDLRQRLSNDPCGELRWYNKGKGEHTCLYRLHAREVL